MSQAAPNLPCDSVQYIYFVPFLVLSVSLNAYFSVGWFDFWCDWSRVAAASQRFVHFAHYRIKCFKECFNAM